MQINIFLLRIVQLDTLGKEEPQQHRVEHLQRGLFTHRQLLEQLGLNIRLLGFLPCQVYGIADGLFSSVWRRFHVLLQVKSPQPAQMPSSVPQQ